MTIFKLSDGGLTSISFTIILVQHQTRAKYLDLVRNAKGVRITIYDPLQL